MFRYGVLLFACVYFFLSIYEKMSKLFFLHQAKTVMENPSYETSPPGISHQIPKKKKAILSISFSETLLLRYRIE